MASSLYLERIRSLHEELETLEKAIVELLEHKPKGYRDNLLADLKIAAYTVQAQQVSSRLLVLYSNKQNNNYEYQKELSLMQGKTTVPVGVAASTTLASSSVPNTDPLQYFYQCLNDNTDGSRRLSTNLSSLTPMSTSSFSSSLLENSNRKAESIINSFTDDELFGKYIDIQNTVYEEFINLPGIRELTVVSSSSSSSSTTEKDNTTTNSSVDYSYFQNMDYIQYLKRLPELHGNIPYKTKITRAYRRYLINFLNYVSIFFQKRYPLVNVLDLVQQWFTEFENIYHHGQLPGWKPVVSTANTASSNVASSSSSSSSSIPDSTGIPKDTPVIIDLNSFATETEILTKLGNDECKNLLRLRGLKQGGTPNERANRLWLVRNLSPDQYPKKLLAPPVSSSSSSVPSVKAVANGTPHNDNAVINPSTTPIIASTESKIEDINIETSTVFTSSILSSSLPINYIDILHYGSQRLGGNPLVSLATAAWCEVVITHFLYLLNDIIKDTRRRIEKRQTKTYEEITMERQLEYDEVTKKSNDKGDTKEKGKGGGGTMTATTDSDDDDEEDTPIYNPLNIPLGWDGKPIPYWLYKLHGLNIEFTCEICGNEKYQGRRNYDRHFQEAKHAYGMRCLGIPNTKHFHDITKIADAKKLYERIKHTLKDQLWKADTNEEFEDSLGNVLNRKTYEDLARQGLL